MDSSGVVILIFIGTIIVFLICREIVCWYWKINKIVELLTEQNRLLSEIANKNTVNNSSLSGGNSSGISSNNVSQPRPTQVNFGDTWVCKKCSQTNPISSSICKGCGEYK